jgi:hypothetical protein
MDVKAAISAAVARVPRLLLIEFTTWPARNAFHAIQPAFPGTPSCPVTVRPDGFLHIRDKDDPDGDYRFFLEVDRSTETLDRIAMKAACYRDYYHRGGFAAQNGGSPDEIEDYPFVVLFVVRSIERRDNIARRLLAMSPPILSQVWLSTARSLIEDPLGSVWLQPGVLRERTAGKAKLALSPLLS